MKKLGNGKMVSRDTPTKSTSNGRVLMTKAEIKKRKAEEEADIQFRAQNDYKMKRQDDYPASGDQLDAAYKDRVARQLAAGKARKALEKGDKDKALAILIDALDAGADADVVDGKITAVKKKHAKPKG